MTLPIPKYFVLTQDGNLHGYNREDILKCDLATNDPPQQMFRLNDSGLTINYVPISKAELTTPNPASLQSLEIQDTRPALRHAA